MNAFLKSKPMTNRKAILAHYGFSGQTFYRLRKHPDEQRRFPKPSMTLGAIDLWDDELLLEWDARQRALGAHARPLPPWVKSKPDDPT